MNWLELVVFTFSIIFAFVFATDCLCPTVWQWQIGCITILLAWIEFIVLIRNYPKQVKIVIIH